MSSSRQPPTTPKSAALKQAHTQQQQGDSKTAAAPPADMDLAAATAASATAASSSLSASSSASASSLLSPQSYLSHHIFPTLSPALELLDRVRPADPVEYLALLLLKDSSTQRSRVAQLEEIHRVREELREQLNKEYSVAGRV